MLEWEANNAVTYPMSKKEAVLFSKACQCKLTKLLETIVKVDRKTVLYKKNAT